MTSEKKVQTYCHKFSAKIDRLWQRNGYFYMIYPPPKNKTKHKTKQKQNKTKQNNNNNSSSKYFSQTQNLGWLPVGKGFFFSFFLFFVTLGQKKKTSLFPVAGLKTAMRNAFFFFFFTIHEKAMRNAVFIFLNKNFRKKIHQNNSLGFFSTFIKNITSFISKWFMWPFILHALGASLMNFLPWPKLHHIWKKIQSKCTECM